jgi:hypothetical protein
VLVSVGVKVGETVALAVKVGDGLGVRVGLDVLDGRAVLEGATLCDYNDETTPTHNLKYKAEEKMRWLQSKSG